MSVDPCQLQDVARRLRAGGRELTHVGIEVTAGMPAMTPTLEYEVYHELRNIGLQLEKLGRQLFLDAAAQDMRLVAFGEADGRTPQGVLRQLLRDLGGQGAELQAAAARQDGLEGVLYPVDRLEHLAEGVVAFGGSVVQTAGLLGQSTLEYSLVDKAGYQRAIHRDAEIATTVLKTSAPYLLWDPADSLHTDAELAYSLVGGQYLWEGDLDKWVGYVAPQVMISAASDGAAETAVAPAEVTGGEITAAASADAAVVERQAAAMADRSDLGSLVPGAGWLTTPRAVTLPGLKDAWNAFSDLVTVNTAPGQLPWETQPHPAQ